MNDLMRVVVGPLLVGCLVWDAVFFVFNVIMWSATGDAAYVGLGAISFGLSGLSIYTYGRWRRAA